MGFVQELKRRNVFRVGMAYLALAWLVIEVTDAAVPALNLPATLNSIVFYIGLIGLPFALFFAWAFELTPEGIKRDRDVSSQESVSFVTGRRLTRFTLVALALVLAFVVVDQYILEERRESPIAAAKPIESTTTERADTTTATIERSIAVLPFRNRSAVEHDQYFVDGIHDDILTLLTRVSAFDKVISRTSVERYRDTTESLPEIAKALGVSTILEGGVQRAGDRVRINIQLIDANTDEHLWADTYDRELTLENLFTIQSEVAKAIVSALEATLSPEEVAQIDKRPTDNMQAMEQYFLGLERIQRGAEGDFTAAKEYFERAVSLDPKFAAAWTQLAFRYMSTSFENAGLRKPYLDKAHETINHALALDPDLGEAHLGKAVLHLVVDDIPEAEVAITRAKELIPNSPALFSTLGSISYFKGDIQQAAEFQRMARERGGIPIYLGGGDPLLFSGNFEEARANYRQIIEIMPLSPLGYWGMSGADWMEGNLAQAVPWARKAYSLNRYYIRNPSLHFAHAWLFWDLTDDEEAFCWAQRMYDMEPDDFDNNELMMLAWYIRGDREKALEFAHSSRALMVNNAMQLGARPYTLGLLRDTAIATGDVQKIRADYELMFPQLFVDGPILLNLGLIGPLLDTIPVLRASGENDLEKKFLEAGFQFMEQSEAGALLAAPDLLTFVGEYDAAIKALEQFANIGGFAWRQVFELNENLAPLREREDFKALVTRMRARMAEQLEQLRELEKPEDTCRGSYLQASSISFQSPSQLHHSP
jgi:TolB-like protein